MKPKKHPFHHIQLALLGVPFLLPGPAAHAHAQNRNDDRESIAFTDTVATREEKENAGRAITEAERARVESELVKEADEYAKETANRAGEAAEARKRAVGKGNARRLQQATELVEQAEEHARNKDNKEANNNSERVKEAAKRSEDAAERAEKADKHAKEDDKHAKEASGKEKPAANPAPVDEKSDAPGNARKPAPQRSTEKPEPAKSDADDKPEEIPDVTSDETAERESDEPPTSEPEREAENEVTEVTREVIRELDQRKTRIEGREQAQALIDDILGAESRISRAEITREERFRHRFERQRPGEERHIDVSPDQRREATAYFQQRLRGQEVEGPPPGLFGRSQHREDRRDHRFEEQRIVERVEFVRPRYLNEGRRYVHFDSRAAIPAILMAAHAMNHVRFQPTREIAPMFHERHDVHAPHAMPLPPENYRSDDSWVVSYPVDENSMISSEDILFLQGSTQFSDPYSYEVVGALAEAMKDMPGEERFVIEGHASAEGGYDSNMVLSQQRAETIVREMVRRGVSPYRLLPVGYGESEARHPANAAEPLRSQDRRVVVFRMKPELTAER